MSIDDEANALLKKWNAQQNQMQGINPNQQIGDVENSRTDQSPHLFQEGRIPTSPDQTPKNPVNSVRPMDFTIKESPPSIPASIPTSMGGITKPSNHGSVPIPGQRSDICKQCGTMHPPLKPGQKCPLVSIDSDTSTSSGIDDITIRKHLVDMRNIIVTQISSKKIKDGKKFFQYAIIELTKSLELYNE